MGESFFSRDSRDTEIFVLHHGQTVSSVQSMGGQERQRETNHEEKETRGTDCEVPHPSSGLQSEGRVIDRRSSRKDLLLVSVSQRFSVPTRLGYHCK